MARIEQIASKDQLPQAQHALYERIYQSRAASGGPYSILLHNPPLADGIDVLSQTLRSASGLSTQEYVLTALAVARAKDCLFVWSVQAPAARRAGLREEEIAAIRQGDAGKLPADHADLVSYAQQLAVGNRVDQAVFDRLKERHGVSWLVGLTAVAGHFGLISGVNNAFEVPPNPTGDTLD